MSQSQIKYKGRIIELIRPFFMGCPPRRFAMVGWG